MSDDDEFLPDSEAAILAQALAPEPLEPERRARVRARVLAAVKDVSQAPPPSLRDAVAGMITVRADERVWRELWRGVEACNLHVDETCRSYLLRMQAGTSLPAHKHDLDEESILLEGDASIGADFRNLRPGDYHFVPAGTSHPALTTQGGCIVFIRGQRRVRPAVTPGLFMHLARRAAQRWREARRGLR